MIPLSDEQIPSPMENVTIVNSASKSIEPVSKVILEEMSKEEKTYQEYDQNKAVAELVQKGLTLDVRV